MALRPRLSTSLPLSSVNLYTRLQYIVYCTVCKFAVAHSGSAFPGTAGPIRENPHPVSPICTAVVSVVMVPRFIYRPDPMLGIPDITRTVSTVTAEFLKKPAGLS